MGKLRCIKRRKKEDENRMRRCEKRKVAVASEVEEKCSGKDVQGCAKNRKIRRKRKGDGGGSYKRNEIKGTKRSGNTKVKASAEKVKRKRCGKQERQKCFSKGGKGGSGRRNKKIPGQQKGTHRKGKRHKNVKRKRKRKGRRNFMGPVRNTFSWAPRLRSKDQFRQQPWRPQWQQPWQQRWEQPWQQRWQQPWQRPWQQKRQQPWQRQWQQPWQPNAQQPWQTTPKYQQPIAPGVQTLAPAKPTLGPPNMPTSKHQGSQGGGGGGSSNGIDLNKAQ